MKRLFFFLLLSFALGSGTAVAQSAPSSQSEVMKAKKLELRPQLMAKAGLTEAQANRVLDLHFAYEGRRGRYDGVEASKREAALAELEQAKRSEYAAIPLSETTIAKIVDFFSKTK